MRKICVKAILVPVLLALASIASAQGGTIGGGGSTTPTIVRDTINAATFDSIKATRVIPVDSIRFNGTTTVIHGGAGSMKIVAGTGASRSLTLSGTTNVSTAVNTMVIDGNSVTLASGIQFRADPGTTTKRGLYFNVAGTPGWIATQDTIFFAVGSPTNNKGLAILGGNTAKILGGAGNMTITAGTGNARTLTLQSTNSSGTETTFAVGNGDTLKLAGHIIATGLTTEPSTQSTLCVTNGGGEVFINAAATCTVSSRRFKENIAPLSDAFAAASVEGLRPVTFNYINGKAKAIGLIAEEVARIDPRLVSYDAQRRPNSVNYEQVTVLLLSVVKQQQRTLDSLTNKPSSASMEAPTLLLIGVGVAGAAAFARRRKAA